MDSSGTPVADKTGSIVPFLTNVEYLIIPSSYFLYFFQYTLVKHGVSLTFFDFTAPICLLSPMVIGPAIVAFRCRKSGIKTLLIRSSLVGAMCPFAFVTLYFIFGIGGMKVGEEIGWFMLMAPPAAIVFSIITSIVGVIMRVVVGFFGYKD